MTPASSRRALQWMTGILSLIPILTGLIGLLGLRDPLYLQHGVTSNTMLDSNLRFFSGFWLGAGIVIAWMVPRIEKQTALFRALWGMIFLGGVGRIISIADAGPPLAPFYGVLALEILGAPFFVIWQSRVARAARATAS